MYVSAFDFRNDVTDTDVSESSDGTATTPAPTPTPTILSLFVAVLIVVGGGGQEESTGVPLLKEWQSVTDTLPGFSRDLSPCKDWDRPP